MVMNRHSNTSSSTDIQNKDLYSESEDQNAWKKTQGHRQSPLLLFVCALGICTCYLYFGIIQERVFSKGSSSSKVKEAGSITTFMLVLSCVTNVIVATTWINVERKLFPVRRDAAFLNSRKKKKSLNHLLLLSTAFSFSSAMTASNEALSFVSYPTAVLAKSSKLIPTMIVGLLLERKSFSRTEWLSAALITLGIAMFNVSRMNSNNKSKHDSSDDSLYGLFLLFFSLGMDGVLGSCQNFVKSESEKSRHRSPDAIETMLWVNAYACVFLLPLSAISGQFSNGIKLLTNNDTSGDDISLPWTIALMNLTAAAGQIFIFFTVQLFSPLITTTITTTRKFFTILLSVWKFGHKFTVLQWVSITFVFAGLYLAIVSKFAKSRKPNTKVQYDIKPTQLRDKKSQ